MCKHLPWPFVCALLLAAQVILQLRSHIQQVWAVVQSSPWQQEMNSHRNAVTVVMSKVLEWWSFLELIVPLPFFFLVVENLWQIPTSRELSESSYISEKIFAAVTRRIPGVWRSHAGPHCTNGWTAFLHRPWNHHASFKGFYKIPLCRQSVYRNFKVSWRRLDFEQIGLCSLIHICLAL